jgi:tRNA modification GTPase
VYKFGRLLSKSSSPLDQKRFQTNFSPKLSNVKKRTLDSTIYAVSTAPLKAAISIVRLSGPGCLQIYKVLTRSQASPVPNRAVPKRLYSPNTGDILDNALVLFFQGPRSYTGEDVLELHLHGGRAVTNAILSTLKEMDVQESLLRYAEPGEFT